jgi:hypothetical protein
VYDNGERYWAEPPPVVSPRCLHVLQRIKHGWRPRLLNGYYSDSTYLGVYIWEYLHLVSAALYGRQAEWGVDSAGRPMRLCPTT